MIQLTVILCSLALVCQQAQAQLAPATCNPNPCGQTNICSIVNGTAVCTCLNTNVIGSRCQLANPCNNKPCGSNGACFPLVKTINGIEYADRMCQCYSGFSGYNCEIAAAKPCFSNPCYNNGICIDLPNSWDYSCTCIGPYTGKNCASYIDYCANHLCVNNGICIPDVVNQNYSCSCTSGFYGEYCQFEINECNITIGYNEFTTPCYNNATCFDLVDNYFCQCNGPWTGTNCESYVDPCNPNPCGAGAQCSPSPTATGYTCTCAPGFFGNPCVYNPCVSNPCLLANSQCVPVQPGTLITTNGCTCPTTEPTYICVCPSTNPQYASTLC